MSAPVDERSSVLRFLDAFFQDRNIKWMLGIGILTLLGSSLMLVTSHWDNYTPVWKYLILLGYTAGIHGLGQLSYHSLALRKTGTGLMALTVLLIPLTFLGLRWLHPAPLLSWSGWLGQVGLLGLLILNTGFSLLAARRIFNHFLRRSQPTFVVCYGLLALAGAIVPDLPASLSPAAALCLWGLFAVGAIKVNRHVFWLTEEHRLPRVYGFFPILLLGGMFLTLFVVGLASDIPLTWVGLGLVLTAVPVLFSADALARVVQERGAEVGGRRSEVGSFELELIDGPSPRPSPPDGVRRELSASRGGEGERESRSALPWGIVLPLFVGLSMTVAGVCLAGVGYPNTHSLPPTAALAAVVLGVTARRTGRSGFVWLMLCGVLVAYQTCPVFVRETIREIARQGAAAIHEPRMPYAFYGLTYLPLLVVLSGLSARLRRRGEVLFSAPLRQFSVGLGLLLLATSVGHAKAVLPVGLALTALFELQLVLFRDRRLLPAAIVALLLAGFGFEAFYEHVLVGPHTVELPLLAWTVVAGLLLWPGRVIDRLTVFEADSLSHWQTAPLCRLTSLCVLIVSAAVWLVKGAWFGNPATIAGVVCGGLLLVQAWQFASRHVGRIAFGYIALLAAVLADSAGWSFPAVMGLESLLLCGLWIAGRGVRRGESEATVDTSVVPTTHAAARNLRLAGADVALCGLAGIATLYALPLMSHAVVTGAPFSDWVAGTVCLTWVIDAAWRRQSAALTVLGWLLAEVTIGLAAAAVFGWGVVCPWYPVLATLLPVIVIRLLPQGSRPASPLMDPANVLRVCVVATLSAVAVGSLPVFTAELRIAGMAALAGLLWSAVEWRSKGLRTAAYTVAGWQILVGVLQLTSPELQSVREIVVPVAPASALPLALAAAVLSVVWNSGWMRGRTTSIWPTYHRVAYLAVSFVCLVNTTLLRDGGLAVWEAVLAACVFVLLAGEQLWTARCVAGARSVDEADLAARPRPSLREGRATQEGDAGKVLTGPESGELHVWLAEEIAFVGAGYFYLMGVLTLGGTISLFAPLVIGVLLYSANRASRTWDTWSIVRRPFEWTGLVLPVFTVGIGIVRHVALPEPEWLGINSLALLLAAGFYFWRGLEQRRSGLVIVSAVILNIASVLLWHDLSCTDPQFFMIPLGLTLLGLVELLKPQIPERYVDPLRYVGALTILVSPTFHIVEGSWLHLVSLLIASVLITLAAIGLRVRALMYAGTAFLAADLAAMVVRGSLDNASLLWMVGILVGAAVIGLAAYCERHRELMLQRLRMIATRLETWE